MPIFQPTFSGKLFDPNNPDIDTICIEDIAHHLSIENRYGGATKFAYSVAYHSLLVCRSLPDEIKLEGLLHDAEEAYYKDFPFVWKKLIRSELGTNLWDRTVEWTEFLIAEKFALSGDINVWKEIKEADLRMGITEIPQLLKHYPEELWADERKSIDLKPYDVEILKLQPENVEKLFLAEFEKWRRN